MIELQTNENMTVDFLGNDRLIYDDPWYRYNEITHHLRGLECLLAMHVLDGYTHLKRMGIFWS